MNIELTALQLSKYIVNRGIDTNLPVSNLCLQNILYVLQRNFLQENSRLFYDTFEAWKFGACIPSVYYHYCHYVGRPIEMYDSAQGDKCPFLHLPLIDIQMIHDIVDERAKSWWERDWSKYTNFDGSAWDKTVKQFGFFETISENLIKREL